MRTTDMESVAETIAHEAGVLAGYTRSICLIRHLQRELSPHTDTVSGSKILEEAMELISKQIKVSNER